MYSESFKEAVERTKNLGLIKERPKIGESKRVIDNGFLDTGINKIFEKTFTFLTPHDLSEQCVPIHFNILKAVEKHLNCKAYLTIGSVSNSGNQIFNMTEEYINETLELGIYSKFKFHCWLTLETMEIIDSTLSTTIGLNDNIPNLIGSMLAIHPSELPSIGSKLEYTPMLVGDGYLRSIGIEPTIGLGFAGISAYKKPNILQRIIQKFSG